MRKVDELYPDYSAYIEYLDKTYGWDKLLQLVKTQNYEKCFDKSKHEIYEEWVHYIENYEQ